MSTHCSSPSPRLIDSIRVNWHEPPRSSLAQPLHREDPCPVLLGDSLAARRLHSQVERIAPYFRKALVRGESGSGKRLVAQALHALSRTNGPFVPCNASRLAEALAADPRAPEPLNLLASARGGTLFLEELGEVPYALQPALVRFLADSGSVPRDRAQPSPTPFTLDPRRTVRLVGATWRDLRTLSSMGRFRTDLYAEFAVVEVIAPPLAQRIPDLPQLAEWTLKALGHATGHPPKALSPLALAELAARPWPGNLREFEQVIADADARCEGSVIEPRHLPPTASSPAPAERPPDPTPKPPAERLQDVIHQHVVDVLTRCGGNKLRAAELLGISRSTLYRMLDAGPGTL
ncbi:MAG: sigma 54-interacting transcriptional regulator [Acidobacteriota bacterium]|nr:sigma 54-interacting transcriptional regulator [Acidobacteriota bacterium]